MILKSVKTKLLFIIMTISITPLLLLGSYSYITSYNDLKVKLTNSLLYNLSSINNNIDMSFTQLNSIMDQLLSSKTVQLTIIKENINYLNGDIFSSNKILTDYFSSMLYHDNALITSIALFAQGDRYSYINYVPLYLQSTDWFKKIQNGNGRITYPGIVDNPLNIIGSPSKIFVCGRVLKDTQVNKDLKTIGTLVVFVNLNRLVSPLDYSLKGFENQILLFDPTDNLIASNNSSLSKQLRIIDNKNLNGSNGYFEEKINGEKYIVTFYKSSLSQMKLIQLTPYRYLTTESNKIRNATLLILFIVIIIIFLVTYLFLKYFTKPINDVAYAMDEVGRNNFNIRVSYDSKDEIGRISRGFNEMVENINNLFEKSIRREKEKRNAEIQSLQYQINPHFLYNTLTSIRLLAQLQGSENISHMLLLVGRLFKNILQRANKLIPLKEEILYIYDYIEILQIRYYNGIEIHYIIPSELNSVKIPGMILQPIIENSIMHGLSEALNRKNPAIINIRAYTTSDLLNETGKGSLTISIMDNGCGISKDKIYSLLSEDGENKYQSSHIGIKNVNDRIKYLFGDKYGLYIESTLNEFTIVHINLPLISEED